MEMRERPEGTLLTVTVDVNSRIRIAWGTPPPAPGDDDADDNPRRRFADHPDVVCFEGVHDARVVADGKVLLCSYGRKNSSSVTTHGDVVRVMLAGGVVRVLAPTYFIRSRTGGRICVRRDGVEVSVLTLAGGALGIEDPSWATSNCWKEDLTNVVSKSVKPVAGTPEYVKQYYHKTAEVRRAQARKTQGAARASDRTVKAFESILSLIEGGGGGPLSGETSQQVVPADQGGHPTRRATDK